jgi:hypothetical protein
MPPNRFIKNIILPDSSQLSMLFEKKGPGPGRQERRKLLGAGGQSPAALYDSLEKPANPNVGHAERNEETRLSRHL